MSSGIKWRLATLVAGVALMGVLIAVFTLDAQRQAGIARTRLSLVDQESIRIADRFKDKLRVANDLMRRHASDEDPSAWTRFGAAAKELHLWIAEMAAELPETEEQAVLERMQQAYASYNQQAQALHRKMSASAGTGASVAEYNAFFEQSRRLVDLGQELARAHYRSRNPVLAHATDTLTRLRYAVLGLLALLFLFGLALAVGVYRHLIAPLRVQLVKSQTLAERNEKLAALGLLAAGVAHEVRNPLTAIKTALYTQQRQLPPDSAAHRDGAIIEREILRLESIVNDFLQFARPAEPQLTVVSADLPLQETAALLGPQLAQAQIDLIREEAPRLAIRVDRAQIQQALINLVQNAADSIGRSGRIVLRSRPGRQRLANGETDVVILEVTDSGKGIPSEVRTRLFDPFFTTKEKGTGLGLSIAARLVASNGGLLQYQTQINRGSTFGIVLPRVEPAAAPFPAAA